MKLSEIKFHLETIDCAIRRSDNGYIILYENPNTGLPIEELFVFDEREAEKYKAIQTLLYTIMESMGVYYSKHNEFNIEINIVNKEGETIEI